MTKRYPNKPSQFDIRLQNKWVLKHYWKSRLFNLFNFLLNVKMETHFKGFCTVFNQLLHVSLESCLKQITCRFCLLIYSLVWIGISESIRDWLFIPTIDFYFIISKMMMIDYSSINREGLRKWVFFCKFSHRNNQHIFWLCSPRFPTTI